MNFFIPEWKRTDGKNLALTNPSQIPNDRPFPIFSKDDGEIKGLKKLRKIEVQRSFPNKKRGHPLLIDREDLLGVKSFFHQLQNSRIAHDHCFSLGKGLSKGLECRQSENEIPQGTLMDHQDGLNFRCLFHAERD